MASPITITGNLQLNPTSVTASAKQVSQALGRITGKASEFQKSLDASTARVFAFGATTAILSGVGMAFKKMVASTIEVEKRLVEINSIFQATEETFNRFRNSIFQVAKDTGQSFSVVADGAAELARQGLSAEQTATRLKDALILTRISGLGAEQSVKALTAAINGFTSAGLSSAQIVNKLVAVDTNFAVSAQDLADGFARAGSTAEDAGVSFDELLGLVTAVQQKTSRGGAVIGNAFKSIFTRLSRGSTIDDLKELGVEIDASQSGVQKLEALADALERTSDPTIASQMKELAGGVFQINVVSAALKDLSSETSLFTQATKISSEASDEASQKNAELNKTMAANINALVVGLTSIGEKMGTLTFGPVLSSLVEVAEKFSVFLDKAFDPEKGSKFIQGLFGTIGRFLAGPGLAMFTVAFLKIFTLIAKFAKDGLKSVFEIGSQAQKLKTIEGGIVDLLNKDKVLRSTLTSLTATQAQKEQAIITAIQKENALLTQQATILRNIATVAASRGVGGYTQGGGFTGKGKKKFAHGFRAEEATAMALGAPKSVKAKKGKGTIGGKSFVMNNHETEVQNFGRNGDSAVIPHYAKGFVPNYAKKVAPKVAKGKSAEEKPKLTVPASYMKQFSFLVPQVGASGRTKEGKTVKDIRYEGFSPVFGIKQSEVKDISNPKENSLANKITSTLAEETAQWVKRLKPLDRTVSKEEVKAGFDTVKGAKGALQGAIGSSFEVGITKALDYKAASEEGGDFDVRGGKLSLLEKLFGTKFPNGLGDFKSSDSEGNQRSFYNKIGKEYAVSPEGRAKRKVGRPTKSSQRLKGAARKAKKAEYKANNPRAAGFIPNFTQQNKGLPVSQIRAHFDGSGNAIAVTNTRDEPNGLKDAIGREKKGIGMSAAGGFVPNYVAGTAVQLAANALKGFTVATKTSTKVVKAGSVVAEKASKWDRTKTRAKGMNRGGGGKAFMASMAMSAMSQQMRGREKGPENDPSSFASVFTDQLTTGVEWAAIGTQLGGPLVGAFAGGLGVLSSPLTGWWDENISKKSEKAADEQRFEDAKKTKQLNEWGDAKGRNRAQIFGNEEKGRVAMKNIKSRGKELGLDFGPTTKRIKELDKTMQTVGVSAKAFANAQQEQLQIMADMRDLNIGQFAEDKERLPILKEMVSATKEQLRVAKNKQKDIAKSATNKFDIASGLKTSGPLSTIIKGKKTVADATAAQADYKNQVDVAQNDGELSKGERAQAIREAGEDFANKMRSSALLLQNTLNNEADRLKEIGVAMDSLGGDIFDESLSKISELINGPTTNVKQLQDAAIGFQKERSKGDKADPEKLKELALTLKAQVDNANAASAGSGYMLAEAAGVVDPEKQLAAYKGELVKASFDFKGAKDVAGDKERAEIVREYQQKRDAIEGGSAGRREMKDDLLTERDIYDRRKKEAIAKTPDNEVDQTNLREYLSELARDFKDKNREIRKTDELGTLQNEYQGKIKETQLGTRIIEGAKGDGEKQMMNLSAEKMEVTVAITALNSDIKTFGKQFKTEEGKSYMDAVQVIDKSLKEAAKNVENLADISKAMGELNDETISSINKATEVVYDLGVRMADQQDRLDTTESRVEKVEGAVSNLGGTP